MILLQRLVPEERPHRVFIKHIRQRNQLKILDKAAAFFHLGYAILIDTQIMLPASTVASSSWLNPFSSRPSLIRLPQTLVVSFRFSFMACPFPCREEKTNNKKCTGEA